MKGFTRLKIYMHLGFLLLSMNSFAQVEDSCIRIREGFIVKVIQRSNKEEQLTKSIDYFFFEKKPILDKSETPITLFKKGGGIIDIHPYRASNFERIMTREFIEFDNIDKNVIESNKNEHFCFKVYRVVLAYSIVNAEISTISSKNETSHSYSYLKNLTSNELSEKRNLIRPLLINAW